MPSVKFSPSTLPENVIVMRSCACDARSTVCQVLLPYPQLLDHRVDIAFGHFGNRTLDFHTVHAVQRNLGIHFEFGSIFEAFAFVGRMNVGVAGRSELLFGQGFKISALDQVAGHLAAHLLAVKLVYDLLGRLAGPKTINLNFFR